MELRGEKSLSSSYGVLHCRLCHFPLFCFPPPFAPFLRSVFWREVTERQRCVATYSLPLLSLFLLILLLTLFLYSYPNSTLHTTGTSSLLSLFTTASNSLFSYSYLHFIPFPAHHLPQSFFSRHAPLCFSSILKKSPLVTFPPHHTPIPLNLPPPHIPSPISFTIAASVLIILIIKQIKTKKI